MKNWAKKRSLTKALLESLSSTKSGLDLYIDYFEKTQLSDPSSEVGVSALARFSRSRQIIRRLQYKQKDPLHEPPHLSFYSSESLNRLGEINGIEIVIYHYTGLAPNAGGDELVWQSKRLEPYHDFRAYSNNQPDLVTVFYVVTSRKQLFRMPDGFEGFDWCHTIWPPFFADKNALFSTVDLPDTPEPDQNGFDNFLSLCDCVLKGAEAIAADGGDDDDLGDDKFYTPREFMDADRHALARRWSSVVGNNMSVIVVTFVRTGGRLVTARRFMSVPAKARFITLCAVPAVSNLTPRNRWKDCPESVCSESPVVCIYGGRTIVRLSEPFRRRVVQTHRRAVGLKERLLNRHTFRPSAAKVLPSDVTETARRKRDSKKRIRAGDLIEKMCQCNTCAVDSSYNLNMSKSGPERLCTSPYTLRQLLRIMGCLNENTEKIVEELCRLSIASMDIEARTVTIDLSDARPGPQCWYQEISESVLEGFIKKVQKPVMIAHTDELSMEREAGGRWCATAENDSENAIFRMFAKYWTHVKMCKQKAQERKEAIAKPLLDMVKRYNQVYFDYAQNYIASSYVELSNALQEKEAEIRAAHSRDGDILTADDLDQMIKDARTRLAQSEEWRIPDLPTACKAYRHMIPGLLETQLRKLIHRYVVFTFYG